MSRFRRPHRFLAVPLLAVGLALVGCSQSSDPDTWESAEEDLEEGEISTVEDNFRTSCEEANEGGRGDVPDYCECSYDALREFYDSDGRTLEDFTEAESQLREDPEAIRNASVIPAAVITLLEDCAATHLGG